MVPPTASPSVLVYSVSGLCHDLLTANLEKGGNQEAFLSTVLSHSAAVLHSQGHNGARGWATTDYANPVSKFLYRIYREEWRYLWQKCIKLITTNTRLSNTQGYNNYSCKS